MLLFIFRHLHMIKSDVNYLLNYFPCRCSVFWGFVNVLLLLNWYKENNKFYYKIFLPKLCNLSRITKWKTTNYHTVGAVPKYNKITRERGKNGYYRQSVVRIDTLYHAVTYIFLQETHSVHPFNVICKNLYSEYPNRGVIKTYISKSTQCVFWNNLHQVGSKSNDWKSQIVLKYVVVRKQAKVTNAWGKRVLV